MGWPKIKSKSKNEESARDAICREYPEPEISLTTLELDRLEKIDKIVKFVLECNAHIHDKLTFCVTVRSSQVEKPSFGIIMEEESHGRGTIISVKELDMLRSELSKIGMQLLLICSGGDRDRLRLFVTENLD